MDVEPSFSTPIRYFERPDVTPVLRELIQVSALPLRDLEVDFAIDSSGFASTAYNWWPYCLGAATLRRMLQGHNPLESSAPLSPCPPREF